MSMFDCPHCGDTHHVNDFCATGPMSQQAAPSNANTSGLVSEIEAEMEGRQRGYADLRGELLFRCRDRIAKLDKEVERWISAYNAAHDQATENGGRANAARDRATAAEARADRLTKAGDRLIDALHRYGFPVSGGARVALTDRGSNEALELDEAASNFRAALQQETQP